jgi:molybdate transport repressor ModE-like protein
MEIRELRAFIDVAEEGSLSAAARKLHLSQSALSQTVLSLERQLGVQLLERHSTGVTTTGAGAILLREGRALIAEHDRVLAAVTGQAVASPGVLRIGVPLELPAGLLPRALAYLGADFPNERTEISHASSAAQLAALAEGELDVALARERPADPGYDAVLAVEEALGVVLAADRAGVLAGPHGIRLHDLAGLEWLSFPRAESPAWYDQVASTLRSHGLVVDDRLEPGDGPLIAQVKLAAVASGRAFALAPPDWTGPHTAVPLPAGVTWRPLTGDPIVRRTWAVWPASSRRRDLAALIAALDITSNVTSDVATNVTTDVTSSVTTDVTSHMPEVDQ